MPSVKSFYNNESPSKVRGELITVKFDFVPNVSLDNLPLHDPTFLISVLSGDDSYPQDILYSAPLLDGTVITQQIIDGVPGVIYNIACYIYDDIGGLYIISTKLAILPASADGANIPSVDDEDVCMAEPFSQTYIIHGDLWPYNSPVIYSGTAPAGLTLSMVNSNYTDDAILFSGTPIGATAVYTFVIRVIDVQGNYLYSDPMTIDLIDCVFYPLYITVTSNGYAILSDDAIVFETIYTGVAQNLRAVSATVEGRVCSMGNNGYAVYSDDRGQTWNNAAIGIANFYIMDMCYSETHSVFIGVGRDTGGGSPAPGIIATSPTGEIWTNRSPAAIKDAVSITENAGHIVVVGGNNSDGVYTSDDAVTFTKVSTSKNFQAVRYYGSLYYGMVDGSLRTIVTSPTGVTWTVLGDCAGAGWSFVSGASGFAIGAAGATYGIWTSIDAYPTWAHPLSGINTFEQASAGNYFGGKYLWGTGSSGGYKIIISSDLVSFSTPIVSNSTYGYTEAVWAGETHI